MTLLRPRCYLKAGRLTPPQANALRSSAVVLKPRDTMPWHSTQAREELLIILDGHVQVMVRNASGRARRLALRCGMSLFVPAQTWHAVLNPSTRHSAGYVYVTAAVRGRASA